MSQNATVEIIEQPASHSMRFRYSCEGRSAGSIMGVNSTYEDKTFPAIRVLNYDGEAVVIVSCVSTEKPYRPHPNLLIGKLCTRGVCNFEFTTKASEPTILKFPQLGIQVAKRTEILKNLEEREFLRIDPFKTGFQHKEKIKFINLSTTRLCFQVLLKPDATNPKRLQPLTPVVSAPIYDKHRANTQLLIHDVSDSSSSPLGGKKIMIFCDKIDRKDIRIRFYEEGTGETVVWEDWAVFKPNNVHKQVAISFKTPKYKVQDISKPINVFFHLQRLSDGMISNSIPFQYVPDMTNINLSINTKKRKIDNSQALYEFLQVHEADNRQKSKMKCNIDPNEACGQNNAAANFSGSSLYVPNNNRMKPQHCDNFQKHDQHDPLPLPQLQQQEYQWPHEQQLHHKQYQNEQRQCEQSQFQQTQYQQMHHQQSQPQYLQMQQPSQSQFHPIQHQQLQPQYPQMQHLPLQSHPKTEPGYGNYLSTYSQPNYYSDARNSYGVAANIDPHNISNIDMQSKPLNNSQNPILDICPTQMKPLNNHQNPTLDICPMQVNCDAQHLSCSQVGSVYAADKVIIQQFCNNSLTFNQQQNVPEVQNASECLNFDLPIL